MKECELKYLREKLLETREELKQKIKRFNDINEINYNNGIELSMYDNHPAEIGSETYEIEKNIALNQHQVKQLKDIDEALKRINRGDYGICQKCEQQIPFDRLEVMPTSNMCIICQEQNEIDTKGSKDGERPIEEQSLYPPYRRTFLDDTDYVAYDGEDTWQDIAQYNKTPNIALDWYDNNLYDSEKIKDRGDIEEISNRQYIDQLPDS